jgi:Holliday junction resolvase RusA-like endonuclease
MRYKFEIPYRKPLNKSDLFNGLPLSNNVWKDKHWAIKGKLATRWRNHIQSCLILYHALNKITQGHTFNKATVTITVYKSGQPFDNDNINIKPILDALVKNNIILDDKPSVIGKAIVNQIRVNHRNEQKTIIQVEEVE